MGGITHVEKTMKKLLLLLSVLLLGAASGCIFYSDREPRKRENPIGFENQNLLIWSGGR